MIKKLIQQIGNYKFLSFILVVSLFALSGCKSNVLSSEEVPSTQPQMQQPQAPPAPLVVKVARNMAGLVRPSIE